MIGRRPHDDAQAFEDAWNGRAPRDETIADLVQFAEGLCEAAAVEPSLAFRSDLRGRLMTEAATALVPMPGSSRPTTEPRVNRSSRPARRRIAGLAATLIASAGAVSLVASSASALPGEMLYPVKRTVESVELTLHRGDSNRGAFQLAQASERLAEARKLSAEDASPALITKALDSFSESATEGSSRLFKDFSSSGQEKSVRKVNDFAATAGADLNMLSNRLPDEATGALAAASDAVSMLASEASSLCLSCVSPDVRALVNSVTNLTKKDDKPTSAEPASNTDNGAKASPPAPTANPTGGSPAKTTQPAPTTAAPTKPAPAATTKPPSLTDITDPLLGGLLGDDDQEGLVPGLLNGLLGGKK